MRHISFFSICFVLIVSAGRADEITFINEARERTTLQARILGEGQGFQALERTDGQIELVSNAAIISREPGADPTPLDVDEMQALLEEEFGEDLTLFEANKPFLVGLVLASPIDRTAELRAGAFMKKASRFMENVDNVFLKYARSMRFPLRELRFPLVLLIFESDDDFNRYAERVTGGRGLSVSVIAGFYSGLSNWLAVRMSACDSFEVPLHEAIHLQMYNRVFNRIAPIPKWFDEGIATGFESSGERIDVNPAKVNARYARQVKAMSSNVEWRTVIANDSAFTADVLAGDAYTLAWGLHWMLCTEHKESYRDYVTELSNRPTLGRLDEDERIERFESAFEVSIADMQADFPRILDASIRRQRVNLNQPNSVNGRSKQQQALGEVDVQAIRRADFGGQLQVAGTIKNISPLRTMTYYVTLETESGVYADWVISNLAPGKQVALEKKVATKIAPGYSGGASSTYRVWVRSTPAESDESSNWRNGNVPKPVMSKSS